MYLSVIVFNSTHNCLILSSVSLNEYFEGKKPWVVPCDLAFPCATQNEISEADATIQIYLEKPVAIGEHPQHLDEIDKLIEKLK